MRNLQNRWISGAVEGTYVYLPRWMNLCMIRLLQDDDEADIVGCCTYSLATKWPMCIVHASKMSLYNGMSRYVHCAGYMPCSGMCGESRCPEFCLCTEAELNKTYNEAMTDELEEEEDNK